MQPKTPKKDALDEMFDGLDLGEALDGWSVQTMAKTVAQMIIGADRIAQIVGAAALSMEQIYGPDYPASPKSLGEITKALTNVSMAIQNYSSIYSWCLAQGHTGETDLNSLDKLLPHLDAQEKRALYGWMGRIEAKD